MLESHEMRRYLIGIIFIGILSGQFHQLPLPWHIVYGDVFAFYQTALDPRVPYLEKSIEYPVLTGLFIHGMGLLGQTRMGYYFASMVFLIIFGALATALLYRITPPEKRSRLLRFWIFAPSMIIFLTVNWDIIALLFSLGAFVAIAERRPRTAALLLALGFSSKFYPILYLLPLLIGVPSLRERIKLCGVFLATALTVNLPFLITNFKGWALFFRLNSFRPPNPDSIWGVVSLLFPHIPVAWINNISLALLLGGVLAVLPQRRTASPLFLAAALTFLFLIFNKVFSPQYALWLLPFFVLTQGLRPRWFYAFEIANLGVFFTILPWLFTDISRSFIWIVAGFVILRHAALLLLFQGFLRAQRKPPDLATETTAVPLAHPA